MSVHPHGSNASLLLKRRICFTTLQLCLQRYRVSTSVLMSRISQGGLSPTFLNNIIYHENRLRNGSPPEDSYRKMDEIVASVPAGSGKLIIFVFTVCDNAAGEVCPIWPGQPMSAHWGVPDPVGFEGTAAEKAAFTARTFWPYLKDASAFSALYRSARLTSWRCKSVSMKSARAANRRAFQQ